MKRILSFILGVCLIIPCAFLFTGCKDKEPKMETWDGTIIEVSSADENGVILIETAEELAGLAEEVNEGNNFAGKTIRLVCDMDMANRTWTPIGVGLRSNIEEANSFSGTFDGNGKKIIGLTNGNYVPANANKSVESDLTELVETYQYGLFGITDDATIKNLEVTVNFNCNMANLKGDSVGGIVGFASGALTIENCIVNGKIDGGFDAVGGLIGRAYYSANEKKVLIKDSVNNAQVKALFKASGIVGYTSSNNLHVTVENCVNNGQISVKGYNKQDTICSSCVSGIINYGWKANKSNTLIVKNNINKGTINACSSLSASLPNWHSYAYIANSVSEGFDGLNHDYDFRGNTNEGKVYYNGAEATDVLGVTLNQSYPEYDSQKEHNGLTNMA